MIANVFYVQFQTNQDISINQIHRIISSKLNRERNERQIETTLLTNDIHKHARAFLANNNRNQQYLVPVITVLSELVNANICQSYLISVSNMFVDFLRRGHSICSFGSDVSVEILHRHLIGLTSDPGLVRLEINRRLIGLQSERGQVRMRELVMEIEFVTDRWAYSVYSVVLKRNLGGLQPTLVEIFSNYLHISDS